MADQIAAHILRTARSRPACSVHHLEEGLPNQYSVADLPPHYFLVEAIGRLIKWGLLQAFDGTRLVDAKEIEEEKTPLRVLRFYLSPLAITMEETLGFSFSGKPGSIFGDPTQSKDWPQIFVLMPFAQQIEPVYDDHIKKVAGDLGMTVGRADDFFSTGQIVLDIWSAINAASTVIADCTGRNPNVFYEVGLAHAVGKNTILISQSLDDVPFDLRHLRVTIYKYTPPGMKDFELSLRKTLGGISR